LRVWASLLALLFSALLLSASLEVLLAGAAAASVLAPAAAALRRLVWFASACLAGAACCGFGAEARDAGRWRHGPAGAAGAVAIVAAALGHLARQRLLERRRFAAGAEADVGFLRGHCIGVQAGNLEVRVCMFRAL
jgi:hypothetical protein